MSNIYLVGFMAVGKSSVGGALARRLSYAFVDLDEHLVDRFGSPIREVFEELGEARFRAAETEALRWTTTLDETVIATGGGAFCFEENREIIRSAGGRSVFLDVAWPALQQRLGGDQSHRPVFGGKDAARELLERRRPHYLQATWSLSLDGSESPEATAEMIVDILAGAACAT
jgi:shikimate kinase